MDFVAHYCPEVRMSKSELLPLVYRTKIEIFTFTNIHKDREVLQKIIICKIVYSQKEYNINVNSSTFYLL